MPGKSDPIGLRLMLPTRMNSLSCWNFKNMLLTVLNLIPR
jgi:hypothetical protein